MRRFWKYHLWAILLLSVLGGCNLGQKKTMDQRVTLKKIDKIPYGTYVAYENLKYIFPDADLEVNKTSPALYTSNIHQYSFGSDGTLDREKVLYVIITPSFYPDEKEYDAIMKFIGAGNHVFISAFNWGGLFKDSLLLETNFHLPTLGYFGQDSIDSYTEDSLWVSINNPVTADSMSFTYPGRSDHYYLDKIDSIYATVLGKDQEAQPDLIRQTYTGGGSILIHTDPLALTNFFLLHKNNNEYYNNLFSYLPQSITHVEWDEYFRKGRKKFSSLQVIMSDDGLRTAFWLVLLLFLLIYLFESKRRQRIIPIIKPLKNTSLDFVKTVGRLYYQYHDNKNLGNKMSVHLFDHIRQRYNLSTNIPDEKFVQQLAYKSGYDKEKLLALVYRARMIQDFPNISDHDLMEFQKQTEAFYKHQ